MLVATTPWPSTTLLASSKSVTTSRERSARTQPSLFGKSRAELNNLKSEEVNEYPYTYRSLAIWILAVHLDSTSIRSIAHYPERLVEQSGCDYDYMVPLRRSCPIIGNSRCLQKWAISSFSTPRFQASTFVYCSYRIVWKLCALPMGIGVCFTQHGSGRHSSSAHVLVDRQSCHLPGVFQHVTGSWTHHIDHRIDFVF